MGKRKVYISSTFKDLRDERLVLRDFFSKEAIADFELVKIMEFMRDDGTSTPDLDICLEQISLADIYIIILGRHAGSCPAKFPTKTYTQLEYEHAMHNFLHVNPNKMIFRFMHRDGFDRDGYSEEQEKCDRDEVLYNNLRDEIKKIKAPTKFSSIAELECDFVKIFYELKPTLIKDFSGDELKSIIDRVDQVSKFQDYNTAQINSKVLLIHYQSRDIDFAHHLNYRISKNELHLECWEFDNEFVFYMDEINCKSADNDDFVNRFVNKIALDLQKPAANDFEKFINLFETDPNLKVVIPIQMTHSIETTDVNITGKLNHFFQKFIDNADRILGRIVFIINMRRETEEEIDEPSMQAIWKAIPQLNSENYLGKLKDVQEEDVRRWLRRYAGKANILAVERHIKKYFLDTAFDKPMAFVVEESEKFIVENKEELKQKSKH